MTHICVGNQTTIGSDNGLSPGRRQAVIWTNAGLLLIGPLGTNFSEMLFGIQTFSFKKMHFKMSSAKWRPFCFGLNVLTVRWNISITTGLSFAQHPVAIRQQVKHWLTFYILNCIQGNWYILWFFIIPSQSENLTDVETHFPKKLKNWFKYSIDIAEEDLFTKSLSKWYWPSQPEDICCI